MSEPVDEQGLHAGLIGALGIYISETSLAHAVGETGLIKVSLECFLEKGRVQWTKGGVGFERRINMAGARA